MKIRVWTGTGELLSIYGDEITDFNSFCSWIASQPDGVIEVQTGKRWAVLTREAVPFFVRDKVVLCGHPALRSSGASDSVKQSPELIFHEAWKRAQQLSGFWDTGINGFLQKK